MPICRTSPRRLAGPAFVVVTLVLSACGGGGDNGAASGDATTTLPGSTSASGAPSASPAWPDDYCGIVSEDAVTEAVGEPVTAEAYPPYGCLYSSGALVEYYRTSVECEGIEARSDQPEIVDGVGARALFGDGNTDGVLAVTLEDGRCFIVHGEYSGEGADDSRITVARAVVDAA